jgi:hypothetical protein
MAGLIALFIPDELLSERFRIQGIIFSRVVMGVTTLLSKKINRTRRERGSDRNKFLFRIIES